MTKTWTMNETQKNFINLLKEYPNGVTLLELKLEKGIEFKTGSINTLIAKKLVTATEEKEFYDINFIFTNTAEDDNAKFFPLMGYKKSDATLISWIKQSERK